MGAIVERLRTALEIVFEQRGYRGLAAGLFALFLALYAITLPATFTGGRVGLVSLQYLTPTLAFFAFVLAVLASLTFTLAIYGFRQVRTVRGPGVGLFGTVLAIVPSMVCCTPVVPTLLALLGASAPTIFVTTGRIQGLIASWEVPILAFASGLLAYALARSAMRLVTGCRLQPARRAA